MNLVWRLYNEKNFVLSLIFQSFGPFNKSRLGKSWQIVDFIFTFQDFWFLAGLSIKRTFPEWTSCPILKIGKSAPFWKKVPSLYASRQESLEKKAPIFLPSGHFFCMSYLKRSSNCPYSKKSPVLIPTNLPCPKNILVPRLKTICYINFTFYQIKQIFYEPH